MNNIQIFKFENQRVRTINIEEEVFFLGNDVARILGYSRTGDAVSQHVDKDDKKTLTYKAFGETEHSLWGANDYSNKAVVNESGLYDLIFGSKLPSAKKFKRWVTKEVLPSIRKNGAYATPETIESIIANPDFGIQLLSNLKEEKEKNLLLEQQVAEYEPKISYLDSILESTDTVAITQIAADYGLSAMAMNKKLHELKVQHKVSGQWILYTKHQREGYTKSHTVKVPKADGTEKVVMNTKWTQKGRLFIYELLKDNGIYPLMDIEQLQLA
ncbi:phage antirepressor [Carnobacterium divergens]|uniref:phage antirepressor n=1 Tax=Carnobacterium divergens TaxID=2748 RepID=UPI0039B11F71